MGQAATFLVIAIVWVLLHVYLVARMPRPTSAAGRIATRSAGLVLALLPIITMSLGRARAVGSVADTIQTVGFISLGFSSLAVTFVLVLDVVRGIGKLAMKITRTRPAPSAVDAQRRDFLGRLVNVGAVAGASGLTAIGYSLANRAPQLVEIDVPIVGLSDSLRGFRIVQLTDLHVGPTIKNKQLSVIVDMANELQADVVAVTGDVVDGLADLVAHELEPLGQLSSRHGTYYVTGNHEYYWGAQSWIDVMTRLGATALLDSHRVIQHGNATLLVAGVTDYTSKRFVPEHVSDPERAAAGAPPCDFRLLLAHQPKSIHAAARAGYDLQISGHTHAGQYFPWNLVVPLVQPYVFGLHLHERTWIYVSRGTGYWGPPVRTPKPGELTLLRLVRAESDVT